MHVDINPSVWRSGGSIFGDFNLDAFQWLPLYKVRVQKFSSDALFTPKIDIFKQTILNTAYIKTLEIFPSAKESLYIQTSTSKSVRNQSCFHSWFCQLVWKWLRFLYGAPYKKVHGNRYQILKRPFLRHLVIFKDSVTFFMLSTCLLIQGQIFADSHRHCTIRGGGEDGHFWCKKGIGRIPLP